MRIRSITPILIVEAIEPLVPFWQDRAGMARTMGVDESGRLGFAAFAADRAELMMQTRTSLADDLPAIAALNPMVVLYVGVDSIDEIEANPGSAEVLVPRRRTFYGATEIWVRDVDGGIVGYSAGAQDEQGAQES